MAIQIGTWLTPAPITDVSQALRTRMSQTCNITQDTEQNITCSLIARACPDINVTCEADARQSISCTFLQSAESVSAAIDKESAATLTQMAIQAGMDPAAAAKASPGDIKQEVQKRIAASLNTVCVAEQAAYQDQTHAVTCSYSKDVDVLFLSKINQTSSCVFMNALAAIAAARKAVADAHNAGQKQNIVGTAIIVGVSYLVFLALLIVFIRF
jgi:hypothetical protein